MERLNDGSLAYASKRWKALRTAHLDDHPLCVYCTQAGHTEAATHVDHIVPHRGCPDLFHDEQNLQGLCEPHHQSTKQTEENRGHSLAIADDGWPLDPQHPANTGRITIQQKQRVSSA